MFKIDWPCALGGLFLGYYAKGKVEAAKTKIKSLINTDSGEILKESLKDRVNDTITEGKNGN